jgi:hypothetical protein
MRFEVLEAAALAIVEQADYCPALPCRSDGKMLSMRRFGGFCNGPSRALLRGSDLRT